jgi:hypothetical protein
VLVRLTAVALVLSFLVAACGGPSRRTVVSRYIDSVNAVEAKLGVPLLAVSKANRDFARGHASAAAVVSRLDRSERTIHTLSRRLAAIEAPPEAKQLRALLLGLVAHEVGLIHEVKSLAVFVPRYQRALRPLGPADAVLKRELAAKKTTVRAKAAALEAFSRSAAAVESDLRALRPPPASKPAWARQIATLAQIEADADALAAALRAKQAKVLPQLVHRFDVAAAGTKTLNAQRASIAAITAYNRRIKHLNAIGAMIGREEARISRETS